MLAYLLLGVSQIAGLALIVFGAPGGWLQLAALWVFAWRTEFATVGMVPLLVLFTLAAAGEAMIVLIHRADANPAATKSVGIGAMTGGLTGAAVGMLFPLLGSPAGILLGACVGAGLRAWRTVASRRDRFSHAARAALRTTVGISIAALALVVLTR